MQVLEIYADDAGETHFRRVDVALAERGYAPPSKPVGVSPEFGTTSGLMLAAPHGWDPEFHATPRKQYAIVLSGSAEVTVSDGESVAIGPGSVALLNDQDSKGHRTMVLSEDGMAFFLVGTADA